MLAAQGRCNVRNAPIWFALVPPHRVYVGKTLFPALFLNSHSTSIIIYGLIVATRSKYISL